MGKHWTVLFQRDFDTEFEALAPVVQDEMLAYASLLAKFGPQLGRPFVDTLKGSRHGNMKELRLRVRGQVWRVAFAFDPRRRAVLLVAGDKAGTGQRRFYERLIRQADDRLSQWLTEEV